jgi:hypothetical protein
MFQLIIFEIVGFLDPRYFLFTATPGTCHDKVSL